MKLAACNRHFEVKMWYPRISVGSASSVVYAALAKRFFRTLRPSDETDSTDLHGLITDLITSKIPGTSHYN